MRPALQRATSARLRKAERLEDNHFGMTLDCHGRHRNGRCRAMEVRTPRPLTRCADELASSQEEPEILKLHEIASDGTVTEARMDVVVTRPGGLRRSHIDVMRARSTTSRRPPKPMGAGRRLSEQQSKRSNDRTKAKRTLLSLSSAAVATGLARGPGVESHDRQAAELCDLCDRGGQRLGLSFFF